MRLITNFTAQLISQCQAGAVIVATDYTFVDEAEMVAFKKHAAQTAFSNLYFESRTIVYKPAQRAFLASQGLCWVGLAIVVAFPQWLVCGGTIGAYPIIGGFVLAGLSELWRCSRHRQFLRLNSPEMISEALRGLLAQEPSSFGEWGQQEAHGANLFTFLGNIVSEVRRLFTR